MVNPDKTKEGDIVKACMRLISYYGGIPIRNNSGMILLESKGKRRAVRTGMRGSADIIAFFKNKVLLIECKTKKGKLSPAQERFKEEIEKLGHPYLVIRDVEDLAKYLNKEVSKPCITK